MRRPTYPYRPPAPRRVAATRGCRNRGRGHERRAPGAEHRSDDLSGGHTERGRLHILRSVHYGYRGWRGTLNPRD